MHSPFTTMWSSKARSPSHSRLETLPLEVLEVIAQFACVDGGATGCALSRVSRGIRIGSASSRFHTIALRGAHQIRPFLALMRRLEVPASPRRWNPFKQNTVLSPVPPPIIRVRHLFLADCAEDDYNGTDWVYNAPPWIAKTVTKATRWAKGRQASLEPNYVMYSENAEAAVHELLARLAPGLLHLCLEQRLALNTGACALVPTALPALVELTFRSNMSRLRATAYADELVAFDVPQLRRLHVISTAFSVPDWRLRYLPSNLTHLRISRVQAPTRLLRLLSYQASKETWPLGLATILVCPEDDRNRSNPPTLKFWNKAARHKANILTLVRSFDYDGYYDVQGVYNDWLDQMKGGSGFWVEGTAIV
jgi:hypothetical protein